MRNILITIFLLFSVQLFGQKNKFNLVDTLPKLGIHNLIGQTFDLKDLCKGKVTFIDFWFVPCGPCFAEMKMLHKLYQKYKGNPNVSFLTITLTDTLSIRPLMENRNTDSNQVYLYFQSVTKLDTFQLPVYFINNYSQKIRLFVKSSFGFGGGNQKMTNVDLAKSPERVFKIQSYPTIIIFDKKGKRVYSKTGFNINSEIIQQKEIEDVINSKF